MRTRPESQVFTEPKAINISAGSVEELDMTKAAIVVEFPVSIPLECQLCGAAGQGSCQCGVPYVPTEAIADNPGLALTGRSNARRWSP